MLKKDKVILGIFVAIAIGMVLVLCSFCSINTDEMYTIARVNSSWADALSALKADVHPPLYYFGLKLWTDILGKGIFRMHLFSAIGFFVMAILSFWVQNEFGNKAAAYYFCFLIGTPFIFQKTTELRMYDWLSMWCIINGICAYSIIKRSSKKYWIGFVISGLGAAYTQYYGVLVMICTYIGLLICMLVEKRGKDIKAWFIGAVATVIGYLPWLPTAFRQLFTVTGDYWIKTKDSRLGDIRELFVNSIPYTYHVYVALTIILPVVAVIMLIVAKNKADREAAWWSFFCEAGFWFIWVVGMAFIIFKDRPILVSRYYVAATLLLLLGSIIFIKKLHPIVVAILCAFLVIVGMKAYSVRIEAMMLDQTREFVSCLKDNNDCDISKLYFMEADNDYIWRYAEFYVDDLEVVEYNKYENSDENIYYIEPIARVNDETSISFREGMDKLGEFWCGEIYLTLYKK